MSQRLRRDMEKFLEIIADVAAERKVQDGRWGGKEFDSQHTVNDWVAFLTQYTGRLVAADKVQCRREALVKVAALAVAAIEVIDESGDFAKCWYDPATEVKSPFVDDQFPERETYAGDFLETVAAVQEGKFDILSIEEEPENPEDERPYPRGPMRFA